MKMTMELSVTVIVWDTGNWINDGVLHQRILKKVDYVAHGSVYL